MRTLTLLLAACSAPDPVDGTRVGPVDGTDAVIGLSAAGGVGRLYLCGGPDTMATMNLWFDVDTAEGLAGEAEGWTVSGEDGDDGLAGEVVDPQGATSAFTLRAAEGADGLYAPEAAVGECPAGAVVIGGALQGVACAAALAPAQVVPVGLIGEQRSRIEVRTEGDPSLAFAVVPVEP